MDPPSYDQVTGSSKGAGSGSSRRPPEKPPTAAKSFPPPPSHPAAGATAFAAILLSSSDLLRLLYLPESVISALDAAIPTAWPQGVQGRQRMDADTFEFKLRGRPWYGQGSEAIPARRLLIRVLSTLSANGWHLVTGADLSKKHYDKDTLFFRAGPAVQRTWFAVSFNEYDKIRLIDAPAGVNGPFIAAVKSTLGVQDSKQKAPGCLQLKCYGTPWYASSAKSVTLARATCVKLLAGMDAAGYELAGSLDISAGTGENANDLDSWFFASKM